jgi:tetratricopeptide (TPR) repeat protein
MLVRARSAEQSGRFVAAARRLTRVRRDPASTEFDRVDEALLSGLVSYRQGRRRAALTDCRRGLLGARRLGDDRRRAQAHLQLEMIRWTEGHRHAARHETCAELLFRRTNDPRGLGYLLLNRGVNRLNQGPWDLALHDCFEAQSVLDGAGYLIDGAIAEMNAGVVLTRQGRPEETVARAERIAMVFNGLGWPEGVAYLDVSVGAALAQQGRVEDALARLRRAEAVFVAKKNGEFIGEARRQQAVALLYARRPEQALEALEGIDPDWFDLDPVLEVGVLWLRGHVALQLGDEDQGRVDLEHALALAEERILPYDRAMIAWSLELQAERAADGVRALQWRTLRTELFTALGVNDSLPPLPI